MIEVLITVMMIGSIKQAVDSFIGDGTCLSLLVPQEQ